MCRRCRLARHLAPQRCYGFELAPWVRLVFEPHTREDVLRVGGNRVFGTRAPPSVLFHYLTRDLRHPAERTDAHFVAARRVYELVLAGPKAVRAELAALRLMETA